MSVNPYVQYGAGVQKRFGDRFTGFVQALIRNNTPQASMAAPPSQMEKVANFFFS